MPEDEELMYFEAKDYFSPQKNCKVFSLSYPQHTGERLHSHDYMQIWYVARGVCHHWVEGREHTLVRGEAFILPPDLVHKTTLETDTEIICCEFSLDNFLMTKEGSSFSVIMEPLLDLSFMNYFVTDEQSVRPKFALSEPNREKAEQLLRTMLREFQEGGVYSEQFLRVYILELLLLFAREYYALPYQKETTEIYHKYKDAVEKAIGYVNDHYTEPLTLEKLCKYSSISKTYFCYLFKMLTHQTFVEYLLNYRVGQACRLLETTDLPVTKICYSVGFNDLTHFSRTFKRITGVSARAYRTAKTAASPDEKTGRS